VAAQSVSSSHEQALTGSAARAEISWSDFAIVEVDVDGPMPGRRRVHCTAWEKGPHGGARVLSLPLEGDDLDPYLADVERAAQVCERRGDQAAGNAWRQVAPRTTATPASGH
jgi:hypothetical protein